MNYGENWIHRAARGTNRPFLFFLMHYSLVSPYIIFFKIYTSRLSCIPFETHCTCEMLSKTELYYNFLI